MKQINGTKQIKPLSISRDRLKSNFLNGANWNITGGSNDATITGIKDPISPYDVVNYRTLQQAISVGATGISFYDKQTIGSGVTGVINGINTTFTLDYTPDLNSEYIFKNGILMNKGFDSDYTITGNTITFTQDSTPLTGDDLKVSYRVTA